MGQAAVDLPDPLDQASLDQAPSADSLLAQMASDEVDRLLAEADVERPPGGEAPSASSASAEAGAGQAINPTIQPAPASSETAAPTDVSALARAMDEADPDTAKQLDALFSELNNSPVDLELAAPVKAKSSAVPQPSETASADATTPSANAEVADQQLDDLFAQLTGSAPSAEGAAPAAPPASDDAPAAVTGVDETPVQPAAVEASDAEVNEPTVEAAGEVAASAKQMADLAQESSPAESPAETQDASVPEPSAQPPVIQGSPTEPASAKPPVDPQEQTSQLEKQVLSAAVAVPTEPPEITEPQACLDTPIRLPLWLRVLEWINAPLAALSDNMREAAGKIAIMTFVNAIALLLYVLLFRRH